MRTTRLALAVIILALAFAAVVLPSEVPHMAGSYPALEVSFAPGIASSDVPAGGDWVDISSYVASVDSVSGRDDEFSVPSSGQMDLELDNADGRFDPDNTAGPYYGDLLPLTWFRFRGGGASVTDDAFYGQVSIEGFRLTASGFPGLVVVEVLDFEQLANTLLPESVWQMKVLDLAALSWWRHGETSGTAMVDSSGNGHHGVYEGGETFKTRTGLVDGSDDGAILFEDTTGGYVSLIEHPTAAITAYPFSVSFWFDADATPASPVAAGQVVWWQLPAGGATDGRLVIQHSGSAGAAIGAVDDGFLILISDAAGNIRNYHTPTIVDGEPHHVTVTVATPDNVGVHVDGDPVTMTLYSTTGSTPAMPGAFEQRVGVGESLGLVLDEVIVFDSTIDTTEAPALYAAGHEPWAGDTTGERVDRLLDAAGWPASLRNVDIGQSTMQAADLDNGSLLEALLQVAAAEKGDLYIDGHDGGKLRFRDRHAKWSDTRSVTSQATFGDGGGSEVPYAAIALQDDRILNNVTVQRAGGAAVTVSDASSEAQFQRRSLSETGLLYEDDAESESRANLIVAEKADRHRRVRSITLEPLEDADLAWAQVFEREIDDRITVKWRPLYGGTNTFDSWIIGIRHHFDAEVGRLATTFSLAPVPYDATAEPYFIVSTSEIESDARIGY